VPPEARARPASGTYAICSARLAPDEGVDVAIRACAAEGFPLVVTGHGPDEGELRSLAAKLGADVRFAGRVPDAELARLRAGAALAIVPSRFAETFGLSAAEAMAACLPVAASRVGALTDLLPGPDLARMGDADALAGVARRLWGDAAVGERNAQFIGGHAAPDAVAQALARVYDGPA
jgi:glycosyltransferase involved in cell wall biosynthesis